MFTFVNWIWLGVLAPILAVPLIIHLLNRRFPQAFYFSSIRFIRETVAQRSRLLRFRHWILVLLRTIALACLIAAFLKPLWDTYGFRDQPKGSRRAIVILDHSLSMRYTGQAMSSWKRGLVELESLVDSLGPNDLANVIVAGPRALTCFDEPSSNHAELIAYASSQPPGLGRAAIGQAIAVAANQLRGADGPTEIYLVSDFQRQNWADVRFDLVPEGTRLFFVNVGPTVRSNRAILEATASQTVALAGDQVPIEVTVGNFSPSLLEAPVDLVVDGRASFRQACRVPPWSVGRVQIPVLLPTAGIHTCQLNLPPDDLPDDDRHVLVITTVDREEVVLLTDTPEADHTSATWYVQAALNPYGDGGGALLPRRVGSPELSAIHLAATGKVFVSGVNRLSAETVHVLGDFIRRGGSVLYFLDGAADPENVAMLDRELGTGVVPLRLTVLQQARNLPGGMEHLGPIPERSRFLRLFRGDLRSSLDRLEFYRFYYAVPTGSGTILLSYADDTPAMAVAHAQLGSLVLCNFSVDELSSNLARQRLFPAWMQELAKVMTAEGASPGRHVVGDQITTELWKSELRGRHFEDPDGHPVTVASAVIGDNRLAISMPTDRPGFYSLRDEGGLLEAFAVNVPPEEADLRSLDLGTLPERATGRAAHLIAGQDAYRQLAAGKPLFHLFVIAAVIALLLETTFFGIVRRLSH